MLVQFFVFMKINKTLRLFLFIQLCYTAVYAQNTYFEWVNPKTASRERIYTDTWIHTKETRLDTSWLKVGRVITSENFTNLEQEQVKNSSYFVLRQDSLIWFTFNGSQRVYEFLPATSTFHRIDCTVFAGYNFESSKFIRKDTLFSAGGYGFWHQNNIITYYKEDKREWELIRTEGKRPKTILEGYQGYEKSDDVFYSGASAEHSDDKDATQTVGTKLFKLHFNTYTWEELGDINEKLPYKIPTDIFWTGRYFIQSAVKTLYIIDPKDNKVYELKDNKQYFEANPKKYFVKGDTLYFFWDRQATPITFSVSDLLKKSTYIGPFYTKFNYSAYWVSLLALLLLLGVFFLYRYQNKEVKLNSVLSPLEQKLIQALLKLTKEANLTTYEINDILQLKNKAAENQRKLRMSIINEVNKKIKEHFNISNAIQRKDDPSDKRIKLYHLKDSFRAIFVKEFKK